MPKTKQIAKKEQSMAEVFMAKVITEFTSGDTEIALTKFQRRLARNYLIALDAVLAKAEAGRLKKSEQWRDKVPVTWDHIDMEKLARDVVTVCRIGLDPAQKNHINMIPYKNNATKLYGIGFIEGYRGIELKSVKYGLDVPDAVIVKLVYFNDKFVPLMKDWQRDVEAYEFRVIDAFDRGKIKGGFYYHLYTDRPEKNKLVVMTLKDIEKRKPQHASPEFWGGEKSIWKNGKKTGDMEPVKGWHDEMCWKTVCRAAYNDITIDSQKIDNDYMRMKEIEGSVAEYEIQAEIEREANKEFIDITSPEKGTETPPKAKEISEGQGEPLPDKEIGEESPIDTALRTGKEEKEKKQGQKKNSPGKVADLKAYMDQCDDKAAALQQVQKQSFPNLSEEDRKELIAYANKQGVPEREF